MDADKAQELNTQEGISLDEFLESVPPGRAVVLADTLIATPSSGPRSYLITSYSLKLPNLHMHCTSQTCNGLRFFAPSGGYDGDVLDVDTERVPKFLHYHCRNCSSNRRIFAVSTKLTTGKPRCEIYKLGEQPPFGPPTPPRLITLIGRDRDLFLKGRRSENQGLGIGAFAYYRRVVENQKGKILGEILRVCTTFNADACLIEELKAAQAESQFSKSIEMIKHGIPQVLFIQGHNPLTLLHGALSDGLHDQSDEHCLELAMSIRVVLTELAERIAQALKDEAELNAAVSKLLQTNARRQSTPSKNC